LGGRRQPEEKHQRSVQLHEFIVAEAGESLTQLVLLSPVLAAYVY